MNDPNRTVAQIKPNSIEDLGNGYFYYNYDIQYSEDYDDRGIFTPKYSYVQVKIEGEPSYKICVEKTIREYLTQSQEFDLINSYNRIQKGVITGDEATEENQKYVDYLELIDNIKTNTKKVFEE